MKKERFTYLLLGFLLCFSACDFTNNSSFTTEIELINQFGEKIYYWILDEETASLIDISPTIDLEEISLPALLENESIIIDLREIEGFPIEKLDQGIHIILYTIRDNYQEHPGPIAIGGHYGNISYGELKRNEGRVILKQRDGCCSNPNSSEYPAWVNELIEEFKSQSLGNPPQSIWKYTYENQLYYYVPAQCCDQFSSLNNEEGNLICSPDGGIHGNGSGDCPDFVKNLKNAKLIWKDCRER